MFAVSGQPGSQNSSPSSGTSSDFEPLIGWDSPTDYAEEFWLVKTVNEQLPISVVLDKILQITPIEADGWITFSCPLPSHRDSSPSFGYHLEKNIFNCFGCNQKGGAVELAAAYLSKSKVDAARDLQKLIPNFKIPLSMKEESLQVKVIYQKLMEHAAVLNQFLDFHPEGLKALELHSEALESYIKNNFSGPINLIILDERIKLCQEYMANYDG